MVAPPTETVESLTEATRDDVSPESAPPPTTATGGEGAAGASALQPELGTERHRRDYLLRLPRSEFGKLRRIAMSLQLEDGDGSVVREARSVSLDIDNSDDLSEVLIQLNLALRPEGDR